MRLVALLIFCLTATKAAGQEAVAFFGATEERAVTTLTIHGSTDIGPFTPILEGFAKTDPTLRIRYEQRSTNDIYQLAAKACGEGRAAADLLISSSIDQQVKLVNDGCAEPHAAAARATPAWARWRNEIFGLTLEPAVMVYNRELLPPDKVPQSRFDLIDLLRAPESALVGRIATYDIERSGLGYLFAFADYQQAATFGRLIEAFSRANVVATCCSAEIIDGVANGRYLLGYNLLGSYALARAAADPRIGVIAPEDYTLLLSRAALTPRHAETPGAAKRFIEFALSPKGKRLLSEASLIVAFDAGAADDAPAIRATQSSLRPIALTPALLVGLDRHKRKLFLDVWKSGIAGSATNAE